MNGRFGNITLYAKWVEIPKTEEPKPEEPKPEEPTAEVTFSDVKQDAWYHSSVKYAVENKLMAGVSATEFAPNVTLTRAMLVTVLYRLEGEPDTNKAIPFADVDMSSYYGNAVSWAKQNGIVSGISESKFAPNVNITREQIVAIFHRYAKLKGYDVDAGEDTEIHTYDDAHHVSDFATDSMKYAVGSGLIKGKTEDTLNPKDNATRAEFAAIIERFIKANK